MSDDVLTVPGHWDITYKHSAGKTASRFLRELRDNERIMAKKCPECKRVLAPPRGVCDQCFEDTTDWVKIGPEGHIESFTIVPHDLGAGPDAPYAIAYVQLDGADTAMVNLLRGFNLEDPDEAAGKLEIGMEVKAVFEPEDDREARITDFHYEIR